MEPRNAVVNQLVLVTVAGSQAGALTDRLVRDEFYVTQVDSSGGILREATNSLLIGLDHARLPRLLEHIRECCPTRRQFIPAHVEAPLLEVQPMMIEAEVGGATVYVLDVERFEQL
ncbi:MAG: cyclic-di-AMP receptor [Anaerolineae bacterium]